MTFCVLIYLIFHKRKQFLKLNFFFIKYWSGFAFAKIFFMFKFFLFIMEWCDVMAVKCFYIFILFILCLFSSTHMVCLYLMGEINWQYHMQNWVFIVWFRMIYLIYLLFTHSSVQFFILYFLIKYRWLWNISLIIHGVSKFYIKRKFHIFMKYFDRCSIKKN